MVVESTTIFAISPPFLIYSTTLPSFFDHIIIHGRIQPQMIIFYLVSFIGAG